ncbi:MAG: NAD-dependent epimerase/dehydratase family protein [Candidatus Melainabacteria bacterium]|nr:NAD-dependent epimerase/dehydratase family protein [Candidatus Melainabacteria bacterium]
MKKKILITGGSGFIGSNLKNNLSNCDLSVLTVGRGEKEDCKIDLRDPRFKNIIEDFLPDVVCHFASGSNIMRANENKEKEFNDSVLSTESLNKNLSQLKSKPEKIIYLSSQAVYGLPECLPVPESHATHPKTIYGENKLKAENVIIKSSLNYVVFRISSVYGPMQDHQKSGVIAKFINRMKNNQSPVVFNSIDLYSDFIYVDDLVSAIVKVILNDPQVKNKIYNIGSGKPTTLKEILDILYEYFPHAPEPEFKTNALYPDKEQKGLYLDVKKIQTELNWVTKYSIEEGLRLMVKNIKHVEKV